MTFVDILLIAVAFVVGLGLGWASYRLYVKRNPALIEKWATEVRDFKERTEKRFE